MGDHSHRHPHLHLCPVPILSDTLERIFICPANAVAEGVPFGIVYGLDQPRIFPVYFFRTAVYELAYSVKIKLGMFSVSCNCRPVRVFRRRLGVNA